MKIEIWSDFACPFCYIGKKKIEKALKNFKHKDKVEVVYKAYELSPNFDDKVQGVGVEAFAKLKGIDLEQARKMYNTVALRAQEYDLDYQVDDIVMVSTRKAHRLAKWANEFNKEAEISEKIFNAYFVLGLNINDNDVLLSFVKELNLDEEKALEVLNSKKYDDVVSDQIKKAQAIGVQGVPFFVFDRKFAISGAQRDDIFEQALNKAYEEYKPKFETVGDKDDASCGPDGCEI